ESIKYSNRESAGGKLPPIPILLPSSKIPMRAAARPPRRLCNNVCSIRLCCLPSPSCI
ncbi:hypothetical protein L9F63_010728, partial [Diploptera punctata]